MKKSADPSDVGQHIPQVAAIVCFVVLGPSQQLWSWRDGEFT